MPFSDFSNFPNFPGIPGKKYFPSRLLGKKIMAGNLKP